MTDRPLSIAYFVPSWPLGAFQPNGINIAIEQMRRAMRDRGHRVHIISATYPDGFVEEGFWPADISFPLTERLMAKIGLRQGGMDVIPHLAKAIASSIRSIGDVDLFEIEESFGLCGRVNAELGTQGVCRLHGPWFQLLKAQGIALDQEPGAKRIADETQWFRGCRYVTAPTQFVLDEMTGFTGHTPRHAQAIFNPAIEHGVKVENRSEVSQRILFVGRLELLKGADLALQAFGQIAERFPEATLTVVGPDLGVELDGKTLSYEELLERFVPSDARQRVDYKGSLPPHEVAQLRRDHGITIITSRHETQGNVLSEAMLASSAAICSRLPFIDDLFEGERNGLSFTVGDADGLAHAMARLLSDPEEQAQIAASGAAFLSAYLKPEKVAEATEAFYRKVIADRSAAS